MALIIRNEVVKNFAVSWSFAFAILVIAINLIEHVL